MRRDRRREQTRRSLHPGIRHPGKHIETEDIFDWMVLDDGKLHGGITLRVMRERLPEAERESYDGYIGVSVYEPLPD